MSVLYLVPTPIGNLGDMTLRAIEVLKQVDLILAEDTRISGILLNHFGISKPLLSHHKFNEHRSVKSLAERIQKGETMALVTDGGTPGISDPGFLLARECIETGVRIETLPGPTAFVPALVNSGLPCDRFVFEGFLPQKKGRQKRIAQISAESRTVVIYESPFRLLKLLGQIMEHTGPDRRAAISRELSKVHEETIRGTLQELVDHYGSNTLKGECVIILEGNRSV